MKSLMVGLSRAIRNEDAGSRLATLDIEPPESLRDNTALADAAQSVLRVALEHSRADLAHEDHEFASRGSLVYVPRVERVQSVDSALQTYEAKGEPEPDVMRGLQSAPKTATESIAGFHLFPFGGLRKAADWLRPYRVETLRRIEPAATGAQNP